MVDLTKRRTDFFEAEVIEYPTGGGPAWERQHPTRGIRHAAFRCPAIRLAASCCEQDACQTYLRTSRPGGMVGPASAVWGQHWAAGIPRMGTVQPTEGIARGFRHSQVITPQRAVTDADENGPVRAPTENQAACSPGPAVGGSWMTASKIDPPAEDARGADLYRHHFSVRRRSVPDLGADRSRSMHRHLRANHLRVLPAADFGRDEFGGQGFASALRPRPSDDHGAPFSIRGARAAICGSGAPHMSPDSTQRTVMGSMGARRTRDRVGRNRMHQGRTRRVDSCGVAHPAGTGNCRWLTIEA